MRIVNDDDDDDDDDPDDDNDDEDDVGGDVDRISIMINYDAYHGNNEDDDS